MQNELFLLIASETFFDSSVGPSFLVRKVENGSFPCTHKLGERTGQLWRHNTHRVRTHEKNSRETVHRLGTIIQSIFCAQSGASIHLTVWKWSGESRYPRALPPVLENFRRAFSPGPTDCPWVSEDDISLANKKPDSSNFPIRNSFRKERVYRLELTRWALHHNGYNLYRLTSIFTP